VIVAALLSLALAGPPPAPPCPPPLGLPAFAGGPCELPTDVRAATAWLGDRPGETAPLPEALIAQVLAPPSYGVEILAGRRIGDEAAMIVAFGPGNPHWLPEVVGDPACRATSWTLAGFRRTALGWDLLEVARLAHRVPLRCVAPIEADCEVPTDGDGLDVLLPLSARWKCQEGALGVPFRGVLRCYRPDCTPAVALPIPEPPRLRRWQRPPGDRGGKAPGGRAGRQTPARRLGSNCSSRHDIA